MKVAYIANRFPRWTGGWILNEVQGLRMAGIDLRVVSFKQPVEEVVEDPRMRRWIDGTSYVAPGSSRSCIGSGLRVLATSPAAFASGLATARRLGGRMARGSHVLEIFDIVARLRAMGVEHVHAQHADYVADAALAAAKALGLPFSFAAHANDLYTNPGRLMDKMRAAVFVATCTGFNERYLNRLWAERGSREDGPGGHRGDGGSVKNAGSGALHPSPVALCYHGVDLTRFRPPADAAEPPPSRLVTITRLKEKKGFPYLLDALSLLRERGVAFSLSIYGDGDQRDAIERRIGKLGLDRQVELKGAIAHERIPGVLAEAGIYALPSVVLANEDRDGIPNTILEAMASGVPVVSTSISGIPEVIRDGESGLLVPERDAAALAAALERMISDADLRARCRAQGRRVVESTFSVEAAGERMARLMRGPAGPARPSSTAAP